MGMPHTLRPGASPSGEGVVCAGLRLALRTPQIPQPLPFAWPLAAPARRRVSGKGNAAFQGEHRQQLTLVLTNLLSQRIGQDMLRIMHPQRVPLPSKLTAGRGQVQEQVEGRSSEILHVVRWGHWPRRGSALTLRERPARVCLKKPGVLLPIRAGL